MNEAEYWMLNLVLTFQVPLSALACDGQKIEEMFNRKSHGLGRSDLMQLLVMLFRAGDLSASHYGEASTFSPTEVQIRDALDSTHDRSDLFVGLTQSGGARWEEASKPNWHKFCRWEDCQDTVKAADGVSHGTGHAAAIDRPLVERSLVMAAIDGMHIDLPSLRWDRVNNWQATYWKMLPAAQRATFNCSYFRDGHSWRGQWWCSAYREWLASHIDWYTNPFAGKE